MRLAEFDYHLPPEQIAQEPLADRAGARMLVVDRQAGTWEDRHFRDFPSYLQPGDCVVLNDTRVFPSRLFGQREGIRTQLGQAPGQVQIFLLHPVDGDLHTWQALVRPGRKMNVGERIHCGEKLTAEVLDHGEFGQRTLRLEYEGDLWSVLDELGHVPLPPYIKRADQPSDRERYQTVFARQVGSVAAPTAGLHFTPEVLAACQEAGAEIATVTLHVGLGTFQPLHTDAVEDGTLHCEHYAINGDQAARIARAQRRVVVGTTAARTLESAAHHGGLTGQEGETNLFIYPGYRFHHVDALLTNFHLPQSSLLLLVCALAGTELVLRAYRHAVASGYRFFSYGDCMLIQ